MGAAGKPKRPDVEGFAGRKEAFRGRGARFAAGALEEFENAPRVGLGVGAVGEERIEAEAGAQVAVGFLRLHPKRPETARDGAIRGGLGEKQRAGGGLGGEATGGVGGCDTRSPGRSRGLRGAGMLRQQGRETEGEEEAEGHGGLGPAWWRRRRPGDESASPWAADS